MPRPGRREKTPAKWCSSNFKLELTDRGGSFEQPEPHPSGGAPQ